MRASIMIKILENMIKEHGDLTVQVSMDELWSEDIEVKVEDQGIVIEGV